MAYTTIDDPTAYFNTSLYAGTGAAHNIIGTGFQPDVVWIKERSSTSSHFITDSSRGAGKVMYPDTEVGEGTNTTLFTSFNSDGFTVGDTGQGNDEGETYVAWQWKCNGGTTETAVDESGDNPANVRQTNATAGFSIIIFKCNIVFNVYCKGATCFCLFKCSTIKFKRYYKICVATFIFAMM